MKVLSTPEFSEIIAWTPSGKAFNILQPKAFVASILPDHFKSAKYSSFTRKLHRWGFMRHYRGPEAGAFFHKHFRRGRMDLVEKMSCYKPAAPSSGGMNMTSSASKTPKSSSKKKMSNDNAPAMDTSASSRTSGSLGASNNALSMMKNLGLHHQFAGAGALHALPQFGGGGGMGQAAPFFMQGGFGGGMSPMQQQWFMQQQHQQQQLHQQQQHQLAMQQQQQQLSAMQQQHLAGAGSGGASGDASLDAAIEHEVSRRLKERINAAAFSRQALSTMMMPGGGGVGAGLNPAGAAQGGTQALPTQLQPMDGRFMSAFGNPGGMGGGPGGFAGYSSKELQGMGNSPAAVAPGGGMQGHLHGA